MTDKLTELAKNYDETVSEIKIQESYTEQLKAKARRLMEEMEKLL